MHPPSKSADYSKRKVVCVCKDLRAGEELWDEFLDIGCGRIARFPATANVKEQAISTVETARLQRNVHGRKRLLPNQVVQHNTWGRIVTAVQKLFLLWKTIKVTSDRSVSDI